MTNTTTKNTNLRLVGLLRVSGSGQAKDHRLGLPTQQAAIEKIARDHGAAELRLVRIPGLSGSDVGRSAVWQNDVAPLLQDGWHLALYKFDRLCRSKNFDMGVLQLAADAGANLYLPDRIVDLANQNDAFMAGVMALFGGREADLIRDRSVKVREKGRKDGGWMAGKPPRGTFYDREAKTWHHTEEAEVIRTIFTLYKDGETMSAIARQVGWSRPTITFILRNPIYSGWLVCDTWAKGERYLTAAGNYRTRLVKRPADQIIKRQVMGLPGQPPAIVSDSLWTAVQERLKATSKRHTSRASETSKQGWWSGVLHPADAPDTGIPTGTNGFQEVGLDDDNGSTQHTLYVFRDNTGAPRYRCRCGQRGYEHHKIGKCNVGSPKADRLNKALDRFFSNLTSGDHFLTIAKQALIDNGNDTRRPDLLANLQTQIDAQAGKRKRLLSLFADGMFSKAELNEAVADVEAETQKLQAEVDRLQAAPLLPTAADLDSLAESWAFSPLWSQEQKRAWINKYVDGVNISRDGIESVSLRLPAEDGTVTFTYGGTATFDELAPLPAAPTSTQDVADLLGLTRVQVNSYMKRGIIPRPSSKHGKAYVWTQQEVAAAVAAYQQHKGIKQAA